MISRTLNIRKNNRLSTIKKFAKLMNIKNYFLCEDNIKTLGGRSKNAY